MVAVNKARLDVLALLHELDLELARTAKSASSDSVHGLRVKIRRLTQALRMLKSSFALGAVKKIRRRLKSLMASAGEVRDMDIVLELLHKDGASQKLSKRIEQRREEAARKLRARLRPVIANRMVARWRSWLAKGSASGAPVAAQRKLLAQMTKRFAQRGKKASSPDASPEQLHHFRIAAKKLRYTMELLGPASNGRLEKVRNLQRVLGQVNDYASATRLISDENGSKKLVRTWQKKQGEKMKEFRREWSSTFPSAS